MPFGKGVIPNYWMTCIRINAERFGAEPETIRLALESTTEQNRIIETVLATAPRES